MTQTPQEKLAALKSIADAHAYFASNSDLRMTSGDHARQEKRLREIIASEHGGGGEAVAWQAKAAEWLESKAKEQEANNLRWPDHAAAYQSWRDRPSMLRMLAIELASAPPPQPREGMVVEGDANARFSSRNGEWLEVDGLTHDDLEHLDGQRVCITLAAAPGEGGGEVVGNSDKLPPASQPPSEGELPELPPFGLLTSGTNIKGYTAEQMHEYGERCRLASSEGDRVPVGFTPIERLLAHAKFAVAAAERGDKNETLGALSRLRGSIKDYEEAVLPAAPAPEPHRRDE